MKPLALALVFLAVAAYASAGVTKLENVERDRRQSSNVNAFNCIGNLGFNSACVSSIMSQQGFAPGPFVPAPGFGFFPGSPFVFPPYGAYPGFPYGGVGYGAGYGGLGGYPSLGYGGTSGISSYGGLPEASYGGNSGYSGLSELVSGY